MSGPTNAHTVWLIRGARVSPPQTVNPNLSCVPCSNPTCVGTPESRETGARLVEEWVDSSDSGTPRRGPSAPLTARGVSRETVPSSRETGEVGPLAALSSSSSAAIAYEGGWLTDYE
jgi:hypothetical protein